MQELYTNRQGKRRISRKEKEVMKKNMQKVPIIQEKGKEYHQKEVQEAEKLLKDI